MYLALPKSGPLILCDLKSAMFCSAQYCFQDLNLKFAVRFQATENIQNTLSAAFALIQISNLTRLYFGTSTFLVSKFIDISGLDDFSKISVSIHCFAVDFIKITTTGLIQLNLRRKNSVFYTGYGLFIILVFVYLSPLLCNSLVTDKIIQRITGEIISIQSLIMYFSGHYAILPLIQHGSYRGAYFDEVAVRVIESDDTLSPAMRHQAVDVFNVRIEPFQLFYETVDLRLFKIQLGIIAFLNNAPPNKPPPVFFFLEIQVLRQFHIAVIIPDQLKPKHVLV